MKILNLTQNSSVYTSNVYLVLGSHNAMADINTLVDVGRDPVAIERLNEAHTGVGKKRVAQVILTHSHYDHISILSQICKLFSPSVYAFSDFFYKDVVKLEDRQRIAIGDRYFEVLHTPSHSNDSICLFCESDGVLFIGDVQFDLKDPGTEYGSEYSDVLNYLSKKEVDCIYPGHGKPITTKCNEILKRSLSRLGK